ncbi:RNI-like protein [Dioscorea alata]|uniref:RNI-like protein n=1 Tax=Dioscorea alata TaxID=55571 RepID=A0ACB7UHS5_DIOAL|nr:RNI-like protein [Dioscorea alata]
MTVTSKDEAISASMRAKEKLRNLELYCTMNQDCQEEDINRIQEVFEELCPSKSLAVLIIDGYFGREYPNWITKPSTFIPYLKRLELVNCKQCKKLPSLGSLYFLDYLDITGASSVTEIGPEFFAIENNTTCCFPKLTHLYFCNMTNWEEWSWINEDEARTLRLTPLKKLQKLVLNGCPKLRSLPEGLLSHCTALTDLALVSTNNVKEVKNLYSVKHILVMDCESLIEVSNLTHLYRLMITKCRKLVVVERLDELQDLVLDDQEMETLPEWLLTAAGEGKFSGIQKMDFESNAQLLSRCLMNGPEWMKFSYMPLVRGYTPRVTSYIVYTKDPLSFVSKLPDVTVGNDGGGSGGDVGAGSSECAGVST